MREKTHFDLVQIYFDRHAQDWHDYYQQAESITDVILIDRKNIAVNFLKNRLLPGSRILDAGCGAGITAIELARNGFRVQGVDISSKMIEFANRNLAESGLPEGKCSFRVGNLLSDPPAEATFDCVLALGLLQYQEDESKTLGTLSKALKPEGLLVISGPMQIKISNYFGLAHPLRKLKYRLTGRQLPPLNLLHTISTNYYSVTRFRRLLEEAGFTMLEYSGHGFVHFEFFPHLSFRTQVRLHEFFTRLARILPLQRFANDIVVIAKKRA